jgi:serine/threonine-protein kinase HipA
LPKRPLLAGEEGVRLSLAGAQNKIAVRIEDGEVCLPLGGAPSTHILKPAVERFEGVVFNEAFCMKLAVAAGVPAAAVETRNVEGLDYLLVERYDRAQRVAPSGEPAMLRIHQEDFCQALGIAPEHKYQKEGGPSLKQCFALLRKISSIPVVDLARLLDAVIFNHLVGNNDAHGKNFSLVYEGGARLAPLYDVVSTVCYPELTTEMAMRIGSEYASNHVPMSDFEQLAEEAGFGKPLARQRLTEVAERVIAALSAVEIGHPVAGKVAGLVRGRADNLLRR